MIEKVEMYSAVCDNCGAVCGEDEGIIAWNDISHTKEIAENSNWAVDDDKCYCPKCYSYNDDGEMVIAKLSVRGNVLVDQSDKCDGTNVGTGENNALLPDVVFSEERAEVCEHEYTTRIDGPAKCKKCRHVLEID